MNVVLITSIRKKMRNSLEAVVSSHLFNSGQAGLSSHSVVLQKG